MERSSLSARLKAYLAELPPSAQAMLMRGFERALANGEDAAVASLVLDQLRAIARDTVIHTSPRFNDPARQLFVALFHVDGPSPSGVEALTALTATLAAGGFASDALNKATYVANLWGVTQQSGKYRYYQESVDLLAPHRSSRPLQVRVLEP